MDLNLKKRWRAWLRAIHRDIGYLAVGLTFVYALSGLAINHIGEWDPNFKTVETTSTVKGPFSEDPLEASKEVLGQLNISLEPRDAFFDTPTSLEISFDNQIIVVDTSLGKAINTAEKPRWFLRIANWLHYNRGKKAWTLIADGYAVFLLFLAMSGMFMIRGKKGFFGRGVVLVALGAGVPFLYVTLVGGP